MRRKVEAWLYEDATGKTIQFEKLPAWGYASTYPGETSKRPVPLVRRDHRAEAVVRAAVRLWKRRDMPADIGEDEFDRRLSEDSANETALQIAVNAYLDSKRKAKP